MDTIKIPDHGHTKIIAHRGLSGIERENTCAAFVAAGNRSYFGIETDVRKTIDGHFVLCHDDDTARNCIDKLVPEDSTFRSLRRLQYLDSDGTFDRADLMMPSLQEYIKICKRYGKTCVLELKGKYTEDQMTKLLSVISSFDYESSIIFISFSLTNLLVLRGIRPEANVQYLTCDVKPETVQVLIDNRMDLDVQYDCLTKDVVDDLHSRGVTVNCWSVDRLEDAQNLIAMGVDQITSNILE